MVDWVSGQPGSLSTVVSRIPGLWWRRSEDNVLGSLLVRDQSSGVLNQNVSSMLFIGRHATRVSAALSVRLHVTVHAIRLQIHHAFRRDGVRREAELRSLLHHRQQVRSERTVGRRRSHQIQHPYDQQTLPLQLFIFWYVLFCFFILRPSSKHEHVCF